MKFRHVLQNALEQGIVTFDSKAEYNYEEIKVYRGITRLDKEPSSLIEDDFLSQIEKSEKNSKKKARGIELSLSSYSCSVFTDTEELKRALYFPKPTKFIAEGEISSVADGDKNYFGPIKRGNTSHIDLWLEEDAKPWQKFRYFLGEKSNV